MPRVSKASHGPLGVGVLRDACRLAVEVARAGEQEDPPVPAPSPLRPVLSFAKLPAAALAVAQRVVEDDDGFRARVAAAAGDLDSTRLDRAGWLWLARPDGWTDDPAIRGAAEAPVAPDDTARLRRKLERAEEVAAQARAEANAARLELRRLRTELDHSRTELAAAESDKVALAAAARQRQDDRNRAVRQLKAVEADLAEGRRLLKVSRAATVAAEAELQAGGRGATRSAEPVRQERMAAAEAQARRDAQHAVDDAAGAVAALVGSLDETLGALRRAAGSADTGRSSAGVSATIQSSPPPTADIGGEGPGRRGGGRAGPAGLPSLPPGILRDSDLGERHVVTAGEALIIIDGYNLARTAWADLRPEEERRRIVSLVEELAARSGAAVVVVFDGDDRATAPAASRWVRVEFSGSGVTADAVIADLVAGLAPGRPTLVVSSDREVADDAERQGAQAMSSPSFLRAIGRSRSSAGAPPS